MRVEVEPNETLSQRRLALPLPVMTSQSSAPHAGSADDDDPLDVRAVAHGLRRNLWLVLLITVSVTAVGVWLAYRVPDLYESRATIQIADVRGALAGGFNDRVAERMGGPYRDALLSQVEVMRSRTLLGRVVDREGLRLRVPQGSGDAPRLRDVRVAPDAPVSTLTLVMDETGVDVRGPGGGQRAAYGQPVQAAGVQMVVERPDEPGTVQLAVRSRDQAIDALFGALRARGRDRTDLFDLTYVAPNPRDAQQVLEGVVEEFQSYNAQLAQQQSRRRRVFLEAQLTETDSVLATAQLQLAGFRQDQRVFSSRDEFTSQAAGLEALEVRREELLADRATTAQLLAAVEQRGDARALRALVAAPPVANNEAIGQLYAQLVRYEEERDTLTTGPYRRAATDPDVQRLTQLAAATHSRIADAARGQLATLDARLAALEQLRARREDRLGDLPGMEAEEVRLTQQLAATQLVADQLRSELQRARIAEAVEVGQVEVVDRPSLPGAPVPTHRPLRVLFSLVAGLLLGGGAAFLRERINTTIRRREDLENALHLANLAVVPRIDGGAARPARTWLRRRPAAAETPGQLVALTAVHSPAAEAYRTLRTNLLFSQAGRLQTLVITSSGPAEGKTTTSTNLAATFAQQGMRVALVDCDLRRPRVHEVFGVQREPGLTHFILAHAGLEEVVSQAPLPGLHVIPSGTLPPNPSELLGSPRMKVVLEQLRAAYDMVILDTPPVLLAADAAIVATAADGVVLVVRAGETQRAAAQDAVQQLNKVGARVLGTVLNDPDASIQSSYSGYYSYRAYGEPSGNGVHSS